MYNTLLIKGEYNMENKTLTRYLGYEGVNLDNFNIKQLSNIRSFVKMYFNRN